MSLAVRLQQLHISQSSVTCRTLTWMQEAEAGVVVQIFFGIGCILGQFVVPDGAVWKDVSTFPGACRLLPCMPVFVQG